MLAFLTKTFQISAEKMIDIEKSHKNPIHQQFCQEATIKEEKNANYRNEVTI